MTKFYQFLKLRKTRNLNVWNTFEVQLNNQLFSKSLIEKIISKFWNDISLKFTQSNHLFILLKIKYINNEFVTIGKLQRLGENDRNWFISWIMNNMINKSEYYTETAIESIIISYGFKKGLAPIKEIFKTELNFQVYNNHNIPITYNPLDYGKLVKQVNNMYFVQINEKTLGIITKFDRFNEVEIISGGDVIFKFKDEFINENEFMRTLDNKTFYFENNKEILFTKTLKTKFIAKLSPSKILNNNFITLDIETYIKDNVLIPYLISIYDGTKESTFAIWDFTNYEDMINSALKSIMIRKYNGYRIYIHNMGKFDIIFLLKYLVKLGNVIPIIHNGKIISINLNFGDSNKYKLQFKDSYLLLLNSLSSLTKAFNVESKKSIFPHLFVNENNLNYIGIVPDFKYFDNKITLEEYNEYKSNFNNNWNLKDEAIKYCKLDSKSLHQVVFKFANLVFDLFTRNIHNYPTLPSLAFSVFRANFMPENTIPQLTGEIAFNIRSGYTGGSVDVYIPKPKKGELIYVYDVNSLYPSQMASQLMPVGSPTYFIGNIRKINPNAFGFFYCNIIAPDNLNHPILQTHVKTSNGLRTIAPLGTWSDMIFSSEMDNAIKLGYKFEILWGYTFQSDIIFKDYVDFLYVLRSKYPKSNPMNFIAKILLNSLYGRFGMDDSFSSAQIIHKDYYGDFKNKYFDKVLDEVRLDDFYLIKLEGEINEEATHNVSIAIAAAITAYARIHMSQFKNNPDFRLYYSDTDSAYFDKPLPDHLVDPNALGKMKLENICKKAVFLSPKVYYLETTKGEVIYKVKGLSHDIKLSEKEFNHLLYKDALLKKDQTKWARNLSEGHIKLCEQIYTLSVTDNKRELVYSNNKFVGTKPYIINNEKVINN
jgi:hypothetical protein